MAKFSITDIADAVSSKHGISKNEAENFVTAVFDLINNGLYQDKIVKVKGLGTFKIIDVRDRESVNVNTGERVTIESHGKITFTPDPVMRDLVNKPFSQFETVILNDGVEIEELNNIRAVDNEDEDSMPVVQEADEDVVVTADKEGTDVKEPRDKEHEQQPANIIPEETKQDVSESIVNEPLENIFPSENNNLPEEETAEEDESLAAVEKEDELNTVQENSLIVTPNKAKSDEVAEQEETDIKSLPEQENVNGEEELDDESFISRHKYFVFGLIPMLIAAAAFFAGYQYHEYTTSPVVKYVKVNVHKKQIATPVKPDTAVARDTTMLEKKNVTDSKSRIEKVVENKPEIKEKYVKAVNQTDDNEAEMRNAIAKVNTGAYRIVGTDAVITVKKGENIKKISEFYFGTGMECYVQAHNGITEVKEGQKLKIPKLVNKKKKK